MNSSIHLYRYKTNNLILKLLCRRLSSYPQIWEKNAKRELKGDVSTIEWKTPEGIVLKPLYSPNDIKPTTEPEVPGSFPYTRGPYATMYTAKP